MNVLIDGEIVLYGTVGDDLWGEGFTARDVVTALAEVGRDQDITVRLNSGGGYVDDGVGVYNALTAHKGRVTVSVDGIAASSASLIAMAGDEIVMRRGTVMMIHDPAQITIGTADDHAKSIESLNAYATSFAGIYAEQTGETPEAMREVMREEVWLTAEQAVERGFADRLDEGAEADRPTAFAYHLYRDPPRAIMAAADVNGPTKAARAKAALSAATHRQPGDDPMPTDQADKKPAPTAEDNLKLINDAVAVAVRQDRARANAIITCAEADGRRALAEHFAYQTEMTVEAAQAALAAAPKAEAAKPDQGGFMSVMSRTGNANVGPDAPEGGDESGFKPGGAKANMQRLLGVSKH